jgi:hypothetical protein
MGRFTRRQGDVLHAERESQAVLERIKAEIGSLMFRKSTHRAGRGS